MKTAEAILERAKLIGARFNEVAHVDIDDIEEQLRQLEPTQAFEFLGSAFNIATGVVTLSTKTLNKVLLVDEFLSQSLDELTITRRQLAAMIGLALFASWSCAVVVCHYPAAVRLYRREAAGPNQHWDTELTLHGHALADFRAWFDALKNNPAKNLSPEDPPVSDVLFTDASELGWGCVHVSEAGIQCYNGTWEKADWEKWNLFSSVASEPLAIRRSICRAIKSTEHDSQRTILIYTDHAPLVAACASPCAKGFAYACLQQFLSGLRWHVRLAFIPGIVNPADAGSRGRVVSEAAITAAISFHKTAATGTTTAENGENG